MYFHDPSVKYELLQLVIVLWVTFIVLVLLIRYKFPNPIIHNTINICLGVAAILEFIAIVYISLRFAF